MADPGNILIFNAGSSSLKFSVFDATAKTPLATGQIDWAGGDRRQACLSLQGPAITAVRAQVAVADDQAATDCALAALGQALGLEMDGAIAAVGHRVVHGGAAFGDAAVIDRAVEAVIADHGVLAPLHNPPALAVIRRCAAVLPRACPVAVFDTAFFASLPPRAYLCPVPYQWHTDWHIRRFGFHGISHKYCACRAAELLGRDLTALRIVSCHLGGGCSAAAIHGGVAVGTTMGFTPMEGLMMGTRSGSIDPGILLHLQRHHGLSVAALDTALNHHSGLLGVSGISPDLAQVEVAAGQGNGRAQLALDMFADRVRAAIAGLAVGMGGLEVLLFTDRVGEGSAGVRAAVCRGLDCMGVRLDEKRNVNCVADMDIAAAESAARVLVIHTQEELMMAREVVRVMT